MLSPIFIKISIYLQITVDALKAACNFWLTKIQRVLQLTHLFYSVLPESFITDAVCDVLT